SEIIVDHNDLVERRRLQLRPRLVDDETGAGVLIGRARGFESVMAGSLAKRVAQRWSTVCALTRRDFDIGIEA
ncbi:hypothetical protein ACPXAT_27020, partial [Klebsiella pneumoniae]|uniref:hypothetical protein n=1 Tax=Klebsiella pneumoniae TaxID=573 RepID=UPI003CE91003